jgi:hypothetical protein
VLVDAVTAPRTAGPSELKTHETGERIACTDDLGEEAQASTVLEQMLA